MAKTILSNRRRQCSIFFTATCPQILLTRLIAGILNVLAGGCSLLTLPLLIFMGLPSAVANGTNRIAILCQNIFAIRSFRQRGVMPLQLALLCTPPALLGSWVGASLAINLDDELFNRILALIMLGVLLFTLLDPMKHMRTADISFGWGRTMVLVCSFFGVGIYGGFVQAGVGFLIITALLIHGLDLVRINAIKVIVIFACTLVALGVFILHGQINYVLGFVLAAGNSLDGIIGSRLAVDRGHEWIKKVVSIVVSITVLVFAVKLLLTP